jgi:hypothetical protein
MRQQWGRTDEAGTWPYPKPVWILATLVAALLSAAAIGAYRYAVVWTPLQRLYLATYLRSALMGGLRFTANGQYRLLQVVDASGSRLALDDEVRPVSSATADMAFTLTDAAMAVGDRQLVWQDGSYGHANVHAFLGRWVYRDQTLADLFMPTVRGALGVLVVGLLVAIPKDLARTRERRQGRRLKGPELVTAAQFSGRHRADGLRFLQRRRFLFPRPSVILPRAVEASHFLMMGDTGTGKSALIRQLLQQLEHRGDTAIVYDPALEYLPQFYKPERGDVILNPLDGRSPYWTPSDEWRHDAETLTLATSWFPDQHDDNHFFTDAPRRIFAHLLTLRPSPEELSYWLCHPAELDQRLAETPYAVMIDPQAPHQRIGVLASLNMIADTLALLPAERDTAQRWSAAAWAGERRGWLFLTSTPETRPRLKPLLSLWLDTLVLRLMNQGQPGPRPTWFVLDELATLQRLPQLHTAITENRKSNNPVVLGFQGRSQLETRYGHDAEAMLSQPATKIFLRTGEAHGAKWIADTIGDVEIERLRESRSSAGGGQRSYGLERQVEPLVMASEITGLPDLRGFLKMGNLVVRLTLPYLDLPKRHPRFMERPRPASRQSGSTKKPDAVDVNGSSRPAIDLPQLTQTPAPRHHVGRAHDPVFK